MTSPGPTSHITLRIATESKEKLDELADIVGVQRAYLYRWALEGFLETVWDSDDPPDMPAVIQLARRLVHQRNKESYRGEHDR